VSLRARLLVAVAAVALLALVVADFLTYAELKSFLYDQVDISLESSHVAIEAALSAPRLPARSASGPDAGAAHAGSSGSRTEASAGRAGAGFQESTLSGRSFCGFTASGLAPGIFVEVRTSAGRVVDGDDCPARESGGVAYSPALPASITGFVPTGPTHEPTVYLTAESRRREGTAFRVRVSKISAGHLAGDELVLAKPLDATHRTLVRLVRIELGVTAGALLAAVLLGFWLVRLGLVPLRRVEITAAAIAEGDLEHRVPGADGRTEVGRVALALNYMLENISQAFAARDETEAQLRESEERLRRFVADASHELRTPVAAVSAYAQLFERQGALSDGDLGRVMRGIRNETARMGQLVEDLLLLARLDEGRPLARARVELVDLVAGSLETARMVGQDWPVRLVATDAVEVVGDVVRLRQVVDNLLGNVRAHTPPGTTATVAVASDGREATVEVADDGPGLTADQARRVFERFYRVDTSRARVLGGAGLGLAIVASIVEAHGGRVTARAGAEGGAVFSVRLPIAPAEEVTAGDAPTQGDVEDTTDDGRAGEDTGRRGGHVALGREGERGSGARADIV